MARNKPNSPNEPETTLVTEATKEDEFEKEFNEFLDIQKVIGNLRKQYSELTPLEQKTLKATFDTWKKAGKPKPKFDSIPKVELSVAVDVCRVKSKGKEWIFYDTLDGKNPGKIIENGKVIGYDIPYSEEKLKELFKEREELLSPGQRRNCYMIVNSKPTVIHEEDMFKPFDDIAQKIKEGTYFF